MKPAITNKNEENLEKWLDNQDILLRMRISNSTLIRWRRKKVIPFSRIGNKIYYRESDLLALLEKNLRHAKW